MNEFYIYQSTIIKEDEMSNELKILFLKARINLLMSRGPHNTNICNKLQRRIRLLEKENV